MLRWSANFTKVLEELGCTIIYEVEKDGKENVKVVVKETGKAIPWKEYLKDYVTASQHEIIRKNILLATRNFQHRVEMFRTHTLFGTNNPMKIRHISYRVEFQVSNQIYTYCT